MQPREQYNVDHGGAPSSEAKGIKDYWRLANTSSIDGLPGLEQAFESTATLTDWRTKGVSFPQDDERIPAKSANGAVVEGVGVGRWSVKGLGKLLLGFGVGVLATNVFTRLSR
jgi:hypothetical protein